MRKKSRGATLLCALFAFGTLAPAVAAAAPLPALPAGERDEVKNAKILPQDVVNIVVFPAEEYNKEVTVQPDGKIELSLLGSITVKDLTTRQLQELLEARYSKYVDNPRVTINVRHFAGRRVAILGEIKGPGFYEYRDGMKLLELVSLAQGLTDVARASRIGLLREGLPADTHFNFQAVLDGHLERDIVLRPGDTIYIPKTPLVKKATWLTNNILPWLSFGALVTSLVLLAKTQ